MLNVRALDQLAEPCTLRLGIAWKIQHNGDAPGQEWANQGGERGLQARRAPDKGSYVSDLVGEQAIQEFVLHKKDSAFPSGHISRKRGLSRCHLAVEKNQLRSGAHVPVRLTGRGA